MTDTDLMPFGKYKGTPLQDVPCEYLHYMWTKFLSKVDTSPEKRPKEQGHMQNSWELACYINDNLDALKMENKDLIWT